MGNRSIEGHSWGTRGWAKASHQAAHELGAQGFLQIRVLPAPCVGRTLSSVARLTCSVSVRECGWQSGSQSRHTEGTDFDA